MNYCKTCRWMAKFVVESWEGRVCRLDGTQTSPIRDACRLYEAQPVGFEMPTWNHPTRKPAVREGDGC
jgi:hypothetical protein